MTYIQRLFNATAPAMGMSVSVPAVVSTVATSPILAADQRLGMFPGLIDPFTPAPLPPQAPHGETAPSAPTSRVPAPRPAAQVPQHRPAPQTDPSQQPAKATPRPAPQMPNPEPAAAAVPPPAQPSPVKSLLQRLVEADPLPAPARPTAPPPIQDLRTGDHPRPTAQQQSQHRPLAQSPAATQIPAAAPPRHAQPHSDHPGSVSACSGRWSAKRGARRKIRADPNPRPGASAHRAAIANTAATDSTRKRIPVCAAC